MTSTIDLGIDLGTTNSAVALAKNGAVEIIKNRNSETTPSMVAYDSRGTRKVGQQARAVYANPDRGPDVAAEFKRNMGENTKHEFKNCGKSKSPEELSGLVLSELRRTVEERFGSAPEAAVITVPAMFELPQNEATAKAAQLAGFSYSQLLQEPVAAAIAYGMEPASEKALWLVYDFGGGTFDTSLISVRDGALTVVRHDGDNHLGGADFDWAIVDQFLLPAITRKFDLGSLQRRNKEHRESVGRLRRLKSLAEEIKVELSRSDQYELFREGGDVFKDDKGIDVELDLTVTRSEFESVIADSVNRSVSIAESVIRDTGYSPSDVEQVILVGGTTFIPLVREKIRNLGIDISLNLDPMTVVARGAAVFGSTQTIPESSAPSIPPQSGEASVSLEFERVTKQATPLVGGKVSITDGPSPAECKLTISRDDDGFTSGNLAIDATGMFFTNVQIRESGQSVFQIELRSPEGHRIETQPSEFAITNGLGIGKATLPSGCCIALDDGSATVLIPAGTTLPKDASYDFRTSKELKAGSSDHLVISFLSGDDPNAEHNLVSMQIRILGCDIKRDLPRGSTAEINLRIDESGVPHARVYFERIDEEFDVEKTYIEHEPPEVMRERLAITRRKLSDVSEKTSQAANGIETDKIRQLQSAERIDRINGLIDAWEAGDNVAGGKARRELVDYAKDVDEIDTLVDWPAKVSEFKADSIEIRELLVELGQRNLMETLETVTAEGQRAIDAHDPKMLEASIATLHQLRSVAMQSDPRFWVGMLHFCSERIDEFPNQARARQLLSEGAGAMQRGDNDALENICRELHRELPREIAAQAGSKIQSDVQR